MISCNNQTIKTESKALHNSWCDVISFRRPLLSYGYSYKASCARPG